MLGTMKREHIPLVWFVAALFLLAVRDIVFASLGAWTTNQRYLDSLVLYFPIACWVSRDSLKQGITYPSDWVLIATVIFLPVYMFRTRRAKGIGVLTLWSLGVFLFEWAVSELTMPLYMRAYYP